MASNPGVLYMRIFLRVTFVVFLVVPFGFTKVVVFWQDGFPTVASEPVTRQTLVKSLNGMDAAFVDLNGLKNPATLASVDLLVLPYGSAVPTNAWSSIHEYLQAGGNLLILGGQPLGDVYRYAATQAGVASAYSTSSQDTAILICPTRFPHATLYVITSESGKTAPVSFQDHLSGKDFYTTLGPGQRCWLLQMTATCWRHTGGIVRTKCDLFCALGAFTEA
ncbi:MAG: hypothetical protein ACRD2S_11825 [Terriglobales bacterium]